VIRTLPDHYAPPRVVNGLVRTCRLIEIGSAFVPRQNYSRSLDEATLQAALLSPPHLRSSSVCLTTATSGDAAEVAAQKRTDRIFIALCLAALAALATLHFFGALQ